MISEILGLANTILGLASSANAKDESSDLADQIRKQQLKVSPSTQKATALAREMAYSGMPGYEKYQDQINSALGQNMQQVIDSAQSPSAIINYAATALQNQNRAQQELNIRNAMFEDQAKRNYQEALQRQGGQELMVNQGNIQTNLSAAAQEATGNRDFMQGVLNSVAGGVNAYSAMKGTEYQEDYLEGLKGYWNKSTPESVGALGASKMNPSAAPIGTDGTFASLNTPSSPQHITQDLSWGFLNNQAPAPAAVNAIFPTSATNRVSGISPEKMVTAGQVYGRTNTGVLTKNGQNVVWDLLDPRLNEYKKTQFAGEYPGQSPFQLNNDFKEYMSMYGLKI